MFFKVISDSKCFVLEFFQYKSLSPQSELLKVLVMAFNVYLNVSLKIISSFSVLALLKFAFGLEQLSIPSSYSLTPTYECFILWHNGS